MQKKVFASAIVSELQNSDIHMTVKARLFDLATNLNGVRVTEAFMDEIVEHEDKYVCIPLCADVRGLLANRTIGHMYNSRTGEFHSTMIGSFYHFEKEVADDNAYLVGYARMPKRNKAICKAVSQLFAQNALKFSFQISCGEYTQLEDGTTLIDASDKNFIEGQAIVTFPACEDAVALQLVAECFGKGDENMPDANEIVAEDTVVSNETNENLNAQTEVAEETAQEEVASVQETAETAEQVTASEETASAVYVTTVHREEDVVRAYDCESDSSTTVETTQTITTHEVVEVAEESENETAACKNEKEKAEEDPSEETEEDNEKHEQNAEIASSSDENNININAEIEALKNVINELKTQIAELLTSHETAQVHEEIISEVKETDHVNPFMAEMTAPVKYSLLEKEEKPIYKHKYSLLERA